MSAQDGIPEKSSLPDDINEFGRLVNNLAVSMGKEPTCKPITLSPITTKVAKMEKRPNLLAQIDLPIHYAGEHWMTVKVYGELETDETSQRFISDMSVYIGDQPADHLIPESLLQVIADEIVSGDHD